MPMMTTIRHFPVLQLLYRLPESLTRYLNSDTVGFVELRNALSTQIEGIIENPSSLDGMHETIYHSLLSPEKFKSGEIPSKKSLSDEVRSLACSSQITFVIVILGPKSTPCRNRYDR